MRYEMKAMSFGELLDATFKLYRDQFTPLLITAAIGWMPLVLMSIGIQVLTPVLLGSGGTSQPGLAQLLGFVAAILVLIPIWIVANMVSNVAANVEVADAYLGRAIDVKAALRRGLSLFFPAFIASFLVGFALIFGFLLLIVPGIIVIIRCLFYMQALVVEGASPTDAIRRSNHLTEGLRWKLFGALLVLGGINIVFSVGFSVISSILVPNTPWLAVILQNLPSLLLIPISPVFITLAYFDARIRHEAFDLQYRTHIAASSTNP